MFERSLQGLQGREGFSDNFRVCADFANVLTGRLKEVRANKALIEYNSWSFSLFGIYRCFVFLSAW